MIYKCTNKICNFTFSGAGEVDCCHDCGSPKIRTATADEQKEFEAQLENKKPKNVGGGIIIKPNEQTAAICGLFCGTCPCYPDVCHGCLSDKLTPHCAVCGNGFRACAKQHAVIRCYECAEFPCDRLNDFSYQHYENGIGHHETVIADLAEMKAHGVAAWVENQTKAHTCAKCGRLIYWYDRDSHSCK